ncbi:MAG: hypothetical protein QME58_12115 [Bacteroidota bacterium]|nr:hypothetical protein [Bacteroidota bacterium]
MIAKEFTVFSSKMSSFPIIITTYLVVTILGWSTLIGQEKISFNNSQAKDTSISQIPDTNKQKIIFKKSINDNSEKIELLSSQQFRYRGEMHPVGDDGFNLKKVMSLNPKAVEMVENAYSKRSTGTILMIVGGITVVAGYILPTTWVKLDENEKGSYIETWYWFPGVTLGAVVAGIGYSNHTSLTGNMKKAVDFYNQSLVQQNE